MRSANGEGNQPNEMIGTNSELIQSLFLIQMPTHIHRGAEENSDVCDHNSDANHGQAEIGDGCPDGCHIIDG